MAPTRGRLESLVTVPSGYTGTVGGNAFTLPAGAYFLSSAATSGSSLIAAMQTALDAAHANTITCSLSASETGTGKVTITSSGSLAITMVAALLDLLGFDANLATGTTWTGAQQARSLWLPDCAFKSAGAGSWRGHRESDFFATETASGHVAAFMGQGLQARSIEWGSISKAKTLIASETTVNASWERFAQDCIWGDAAWAMPGGPIRFYPDAASSSTFCTYSIPDIREINPAPQLDGWAGGPRVVSIPRMVVAPAYAAYG